MVRWDAEGHPHRSFLPHAAVVAGALALIALDLTGVELSGPAEGAASAVLPAVFDPVTLLLAGLTGWLLLRHRWLVPALLALGVVIGYGIGFANFTQQTRPPTPELVGARIVGCLAVGYLANALRLLLAPPAPRF